MNNVYIRSEFFSPEECQRALALFRNEREGAVHTKSGEPTKSTKRQSAVCFCTDSILVKKVREAIWNINARFYHFDLDEMEPLQIGQYLVGGHYDEHTDLGPVDAQKRKLSASVQLSSSHDYTGGELDIWGTGTVDKSQGTLIVFPSFLVHKVRPVTYGVRYSLVAWANGAHPFR